jgi:hypothetical protein
MCTYNGLQRLTSTTDKANRHDKRPVDTGGRKRTKIGKESHQRKSPTEDERRVPRISEGHDIELIEEELTAYSRQ